jgi:hypothetical protein
MPSQFDDLLTGWHGKLFRSDNDVEGLVFSRPTTLLGLMNRPFRLPEARRMVRHLRRRVYRDVLQLHAHHGPLPTR